MIPAFSRGEEIRPPTSGFIRGQLAFPEFYQLEVSQDLTRGDCLIYPDSPHNWKALMKAKGNYNYREKKKVRGRVFVIRREVRHGEPVIVVQRIF